MTVLNTAHYTLSEGWWQKHNADLTFIKVNFVTGRQVSAQTNTDHLAQSWPGVTLLVSCYVNTECAYLHGQAAVERERLGLVSTVVIADKATRSPLCGCLRSGWCRALCYVHYTQWQATRRDRERDLFMCIQSTNPHFMALGLPEWGREREEEGSTERERGWGVYKSVRVRTTITCKKQKYIIQIACYMQCDIHQTSGYFKGYNIIHRRCW